MKTLKKLVLCVALAGCMAIDAKAILITAGTTTPLATGNQTSTSQILSIIQSSPYNVGPELYKMNVGYPSDVGSFASSYTTTFNSEASTFEITYISGSAIVANPAYLLVKDGKHSPAWYLFDISGWNGTDVLQGANFWPAEGAISHVAIYGTASVPDSGSTIALLGSALVGVGALRRKLLKA